MKKIYLLVLMIIAFTLALTACGDPNANHDNHNFGDWVESGDEAKSCDEKLYSRTCTDCGEIEWKQGKYEDHSFNTVTTPPTCTAGGFDTKTCTLCGRTEVCNETQIADHTYSKENDNVNHWDKCDVCNTTANTSEHTPGNDSICTACGFLVGPTEGVMYDLSTDGSYAIVIGYTGTATYVKIADTYNGVPVKEIYDNAFSEQSISAIIMP